MPLRPVNAIFVHQLTRSYVIYHCGELWKLPRMKLDLASWQRRKPYRGPLMALTLCSSQFIADTGLSDKLNTYDFPKVLHGINVAKFESWWRLHGFDWQRKRQLAVDDNNSIE